MVLTETPNLVLLLVQHVVILEKSGEGGDIAEKAIQLVQPTTSRFFHSYRV